MLSTEAFDKLVEQIKEHLPKVLQAKGIDISDLNSNYSGPPVNVHSSDFIHLLGNSTQSMTEKFMDTGCALLNIGYENFYFSLNSGNNRDGYLYDLLIIYTASLD